MSSTSARTEFERVDPRPAREPDRELVVRAQRYEPEALAEAFERNFDRIFSFLFAGVGDEAVAEDLSAAVFIRSLDALPGYREPGPGMTVFLYRLAQAVVAEHLRERAKQLDRIRPGSGGNLDFEETVRAVIGGLPGRVASVIMFRFFAGMDSQEVAHVTGLSRRNVQVLQRRGLQTLHSNLARHRLL